MDQLLSDPIFASFAIGAVLLAGLSKGGFGGGIGFVSQDKLVGQAGSILWSTDGSARWLDPESWFEALRDERTGQAL